MAKRTSVSILKYFVAKMFTSDEVKRSYNYAYNDPEGWVCGQARTEESLRKTTQELIDIFTMLDENVWMRTETKALLSDLRRALQAAVKE